MAGGGRRKRMVMQGGRGGAAFSTRAASWYCMARSFPSGNKASNGACSASIRTALLAPSPLAGWAVARRSFWERSLAWGAECEMESLPWYSDNLYCNPQPKTALDSISNPKGSKMAHRRLGDGFNDLAFVRRTLGCHLQHRRCTRKRIKQQSPEERNLRLPTRTGAPGSHQRTWVLVNGRSPPMLSPR